jgi:DNA repair ATPase RecN
MQKKVIKTDLNVVQDFDKQYQSALDSQEKAEMMIVDYNSMASKIIGILNQSGSELLKANARYQEVEQLSKQLGVEPSGVLKNKKANISEAIKEVDSYIKQLQSSKVKI